MRWRIVPGFPVVIITWLIVISISNSLPVPLTKCATLCSAYCIFLEHVLTFSIGRKVKSTRMFSAPCSTQTKHKYSKLTLVPWCLGAHSAHSVVSGVYRMPRDVTPLLTPPRWWRRKKKIYYISGPLNIVNFIFIHFLIMTVPPYIKLTFARGDTFLTVIAPRLN